MNAIETPSVSQPKGLQVIFFTEMWERFSYYGMRALLVLYVVNALHYERADALALYGTYTGLVYLTPMLGGALADRYLGKRRALLIGGVLMMLGHFAMAFEPLLFVALGLLIVGNGFFKPNTASLVGDLYDGPDDPRRSGGYSIFYMGINLGAFLAPLVAGTVGELVGWHYGFACAGVGMGLGLLQFVWGQHRLGQAGLRGDQLKLTAHDYRVVGQWALGAAGMIWAGVISWPFLKGFWGALTLGEQGAVALLALSVAGLGRWLYQRRCAQLGTSVQASPPLSKAEWGRVLGIVIVMVFIIIFWTGFEQAGGTMTLFAAEKTQREVLGHLIPASAFQAINPAVIVLFAPLFSILWTRLDQSRYAITDITKQALGMIVLGLGFVLMAHAQTLSDEVGRISPLWLVGVYAIHTWGELMLSPVGLSMVSRLAPIKVASLLMGVWFLSSAFANYLAGAMESLLTKVSLPLYPTLATLSISAGAILLLLGPLLWRLMHKSASH